MTTIQPAANSLSVGVSSSSPTPAAAPAAADAEWMVEPTIMMSNMFLDAARLSNSLLQQSDLTLDFCPNNPTATQMMADIRKQLSAQVTGQWEQQLALIPQHIGYAGITPETDERTCAQKSQGLIAECAESILESVNEFFAGWNQDEDEGLSIASSRDPKTEQALNKRIPLLHQHAITQICAVREMVIAGSISDDPAPHLIDSATEAFARASNILKFGLQQMVSSFDKKLTLNDPAMLHIAGQILRPAQSAAFMAGVTLYTYTDHTLDVLKDVMLPDKKSGQQTKLLASEAMNYCQCSIPHGIVAQHLDIIETDAAQAVQEVAIVVGSLHHFAATGALQPQIAEQIKESYRHNVAMGKKIVAELPAATPHFLNSLSKAYNAVCSYRDMLNGHSKHHTPNSTRLSPQSGYMH